MGLCGAGCSDHRVDLHEFLTMTEKAQQPPATTQPAAQEALGALISQQLGPYRVGPSDVLSVSITGPDQTLAAAPVFVRVNRKGEIELPIVGLISVAELELEDVEGAIQKAYVPKVYRQAVVHVEVVEAAPTNVLVFGAVTIPGLVPLKRTERNLLHAIVRAGGLSQFASGQATLRRIRRPSEVVTLNLTDPVELQGALTIDPLEAGDIIYAHAATPNTIFVGGLVKAARPQVYPPGAEITILQALAASGGLRTDLTPHEATLIRRLPDGQDVHVKLNLDRITTGKEANLTLAAGDILWVPHTCETRVQEWINNNLFIRVGFSATYSLEGVEDYLHGAGAAAPTRSLADLFDPFGELTRNIAIQRLAPAAP